MRWGAEHVMPGTLAETVALIEQAGGRAVALPADIEDPNACRALIKRAEEVAGGHLDILVNNAGFADFAPISDMSMASFERTLSHYLRAPFILSQAAIPGMQRSGAGWIVHIGSQDALPLSQPYGKHDKTRGYHVYAAVKAALHRLVQGMAAEMLDHNIAVNMVAPSTAIRTPGSAALMSEKFPTEDVAYLCETVLAMCHLPAAERTGLLAFSMHFPLHHGIEVRSLDARAVLPPPVPPDWSHPAIHPSGQ
jgi:NAD(P)-dependent dehydrogenase (short-subunit alcohol dehydrogenase family)